MSLRKVVQILGTSLIIPSILTSSALAASTWPSLSQIVEDTYIAPYQQTSVTTLQTVIYGKHSSTMSIESTTNSDVEGKSLTQLTTITAYNGSPWHEQVYAENGVMYFNSGRGWTTATKNPTTSDWPIAVKKMSKDWNSISIRGISGGHQFTASDSQSSGFKVLDGLIEQVLLRNNLRPSSYPSFESWLLKHFHEATVIQTEQVNGTERMKTQITTLSIHMTPNQIKKFWTADITGSSVGRDAKSANSEVPSSVVYSLGAQYKYSCRFTYKTVHVRIPKGLPN